MRDSDGTKKKLEGTWDKVKGGAKDAFGDAVDNERLQAEGKWDKAKGEAKKKYGEAKGKLTDWD
ncbi:CsbD family protein [Siminovitchia fortis]|uniref:CsbD family protein n=1 Tax=Siminovitchia fortis TaxID=254758 RepID=A0A443IVV0_9BACI|nr:CsbD family protein [Siminovitchia fortis]RWR12200.1 CsbD family protein [Siminovitchia fortis]WHY80963.1 CsbD family protein [Siminovitchia fortis]